MKLFLKKKTYLKTFKKNALFFNFLMIPYGETLPGSQSKYIKIKVNPGQNRRIMIPQGNISDSNLDIPPI